MKLTRLMNLNLRRVGLRNQMARMKAKKTMRSKLTSKNAKKNR